MKMWWNIVVTSHKCCIFRQLRVMSGNVFNSEFLVIGKISKISHFLNIFFSHQPVYMKNKLMIQTVRVKEEEKILLINNSFENCQKLINSVWARTRHHDIMCWKIMAKNKSPFSTICLARSQSADDVRRSRQKVFILFSRFELHEAILFSWMLTQSSSHTWDKDVEITAARVEMLLKHLRMKWNFVNLFFLLRAHIFKACRSKDGISAYP